MVDSNTGLVVYPTNLWTINAPVARAGLNIGALVTGGTGATNAAGARTNLGLGWSALTNTNAATSLLGFTTNGQVVANTGTNVLTFTNNIAIHSILIDNMAIWGFGNAVDFDQGILSGSWEFDNAVGFGTPLNQAATRANLGFSTNLNTFWTTTNASNARTALGLPAAATNPQPASSALTTLAANNGSSLTNIPASSLVGTIAVSNIGTVNASNITGVLALSNGGTGATNASSARTSLGLGWSALTNSNAATSLLGFTTNGQVVANTGTNVLTFGNGVKFNGGDLTIADTYPAISGSGLSISFEDGAVSGVITLDSTSHINFQGAAAATTRTNLGLGATWLTNTNVTNFRSDVGLSASWLTNTNVTNFRSDLGFSTNLSSLWTATNASNARTALEISNSTRSGLGFSTNLDSLWTATNASIARTNIGLPWSALTNTNADGFTAAVWTNKAPQGPSSGTRGTNIQADAWIYIKVGTNNFMIPLWYETLID